MNSVLRLVSHFLIAVLCTFILASLFHSQFVLYELSNIGVAISLNDRLSMSIDDLLGLLPTYVPVIGFSFLLAFSTTRFLQKFIDKSPDWLYPLAAAVSIFVALLAMQPIMGITIIAGARTSFGILCQCLAAAFGGWAFSSLRSGQSPTSEN